MSSSVDVEVISLLKKLVAVDSTSARSNAPMLDILEPWLTQDGFICTRQRYVDAAGVPKENLVARSAKHGVNAPVELALVGHTDCVPFDAQWTEALTLTERDGKLYGRGSCDTKAFIACALMAARRVGAASLPKPVALVFTADEEVGCVGAKQLVEANSVRPRYAIVGEPTQLQPIYSHKGYCLAEVEISGKEGHSAYPDSGASAIFRAARLISALETWMKGPLAQEQDAALHPPYTTVNVGVIGGGKAKNIIAGQCRFTLEWRPIPSQAVDRVPTELRGLVEALKKDDPTFAAEIRVSRADRGLSTDPKSTLVQFLEGASGKKSGTVSFGTEGPQLTALGAQVVVFGPGDIQVAHQTGEFVPRDELLKCESVLEQALRHFAA